MLIDEYKHQSLYDIQSKYIKDTFKFFCYEYTQMYKDTNRIKESLDKQIESRIYGNNLIHNWKININGPTISEVRDTTIHNILSSRSSLLNDDTKRHPIKIEFMFQQRKGLEIEICEFIITK
jgi:hypothetical protein